jgi:hypothetical protein
MDNKKKAAEADHQSDMEKILARFDNVDAKLGKIDSIEAKVANLEILLIDLKNANKSMKEELARKEKQLGDMQSTLNNQEVRLNNMDQHHRSWSARVLNVPLTNDEEQDPEAVVQKVYDLVLQPILAGAKNAGKLRYVPTAEQLLEVAHVLPGKPGSHKPIIMRFYNRNMKAICFRYKKEFAPREQQKAKPTTRKAASSSTEASSGGSSGDISGDGRGRFCFPLYEDLTRANLVKMKAIAADSRTQSCWTINGTIKFKLVNSQVVRKVACILDSLDTILG